MKISDTQLNAACEYVQNQFDSHSWWPKEQPDLAKQEFSLMKSSGIALGIWCEKWLDDGQCRQLEKAINNSA